MPKGGGLLAGGGQGDAQALEGLQRQPLAGLAVGAGAFVKAAPTVKGEESLDLAHNLAAGALGIEHLIEETKEGAPDAEDAFAAVGALIGL